MEQPPIRLLIADDNTEICDILENYFRLTPDIEVCGVAHDGEEALFSIANIQFDVVLLDLIMPNIDGISVLERLSQKALSRQPRIIVTSAVGQEKITATALSLGADYYMIKPYDLAALLDRIRLVASMADEPPSRCADTAADWTAVAARTILSLGIPAHMLGYAYSMAAVKILLRENRPCSIVKEIYTAVAAEYGTTPVCVEGAIRKAICRGCQQNGEAMRTLIGTDRLPPANGRFLVTLSEHVRYMEKERGA